MEKPRYHMQYSVDAPLQVRSVLYVPDLNNEKFGFGRMEPGVSLYARKVRATSSAYGLFWLLTGGTGAHSTLARFRFAAWRSGHDLVW